MEEIVGEQPSTWLQDGVTVVRMERADLEVGITALQFL